jgi:hypothetical protein
MDDDLDTIHHSPADARVALTVGPSLTDRFIITDDFSGFPVPEVTQRRSGGRTRWTPGSTIPCASVTRLMSTSAGSWWTTRRPSRPCDRDDYTIAGQFTALPKTSILGEVDCAGPLRRPASPDRDSDGWRSLAKGITRRRRSPCWVGRKDYENPPGRLGRTVAERMSSGNTASWRSGSRRSGERRESLFEERITSAYGGPRSGTSRASG